MDIYDSTNPYDIPTSAPAVAGYVDGVFAWPEAGWERFKNSTLIGIAVSPFTDGGDALDVETGDATPDQAPAWVQRRRAAGIPQPWVYCNRSNRPLVESALQLAGLAPDQVALWVATLDGTRVVSGGPYPVAAVQWANATLAGGHYDISSTTLAFEAGSIKLGGLMPLDPNDPIVQRILHQMDVIGWIWKALGITDLTGNPDISGAQSAKLNEILAAVKAISTTNVVSLSPAQQAQLQECVDILQRLEASLKAA